MRRYSLALAAVVLVLSLVSATWLDQALAEARPMTTKVTPSPISGKASSSQTLRDLQTDSRNPFKQVDSSFRRIPPSTPNPTQNKSNPPADGERSRKQHIARSRQH